MKRGLNDWLVWQESLNPAEIELKLERVTAVLNDLQLPRPAHVISVAGTNGKGSSVALFEQIFCDAGVGVGCYTSPHIWRYNERIRVDGQPVDDEVIVAAFERIEACRGEIPLTFFEYGTLAALVVFAECNIEVAVLEVGLGGRLDAVNAIDSDASLITTIGLDHQQWLGSTREAIGHEKAGIMRGGAPTVFSGDDIPDSVRKHAESCGARLSVAGEEFLAKKRGERWSFRSAGLAIEDLPMPALAGQHQMANAAGVIAVLAELGLNHLLTRENLRASLRGVSVAGRLQRIGGAPEAIVDVAHNPQSARVLGQFLAANAIAGKTLAICGMLKDKDVEMTLEPLISHVDRWFATGIKSSRGLDGAALGQIVAGCAQKPCHVADSVELALAAALAEAQPQDRLLIFGSFYIAGPVLDRLGI